MPQPLPHPVHPDPYTVLGRQVLYGNPWIRLREDRIRHRSGADGIYSVCGFRRTACGVLALDEEDRVVLVGQWRYPHEVYSWEIPEGGGEEHESPFEAIRRELREETGLLAHDWEPLLHFLPSNCSTDEEAYLFLAQDLGAAEGGSAPEPDEELTVRREPFTDALDRVFSGEITDSLTVVALLALYARRSGRTAPMAAEVAERFFQSPAEHPSPGRARWSGLTGVDGTAEAAVRP